MEGMHIQTYTAVGAAPTKARETYRHKVMQGKEPDKRYNGYTSCLLVTAYGRMVLAEFDHDNKPTHTLPFINTQKERFDMWLLKKYGLPFMYWNLMLRGLA
jgi:sulfide:quinone oxidoreductase